MDFTLTSFFILVLILPPVIKLRRYPKRYRKSNIRNLVMETCELCGSAHLATDLFVFKGQSVCSECNDALLSQKNIHFKQEIHTKEIPKE